MSISKRARPWPARSFVTVASVLLLSSTAIARSSISPPVHDPADAQAPVPPVLHRSAIASYRSIPDESVGSWRTANQNVNRIGGWRTYAKERPVEDAPSPPSPSPRHDGHSGHEAGQPR